MAPDQPRPKPLCRRGQSPQTHGARLPVVVYQTSSPAARRVRTRCRRRQRGRARRNTGHRSRCACMLQGRSTETTAASVVMHPFNLCVAASRNVPLTYVMPPNAGPLLSCTRKSVRILSGHGSQHVGAGQVLLIALPRNPPGIAALLLVKFFGWGRKIHSLCRRGRSPPVPGWLATYSYVSQLCSLV